MLGIFSRHAGACLIAVVWLMGWLAVPAAHAQSTAELYENAKAKARWCFIPVAGCTPRSARQAFHAAIPRHYGVCHRRLQQRAQCRHRKADGGRRNDGRHGDLSDRAGLRAWKKQDKLLNFKPEGFEHVYPNMRDADGPTRL